MAKYVLDTNVLIHAIRNDAPRRELAAWQRRMAPHLYTHSVVVAELLVGARDEATLERWRDRWVAPSERVRRVITPVAGTWERAARIVVRLHETGRLPRGGVPRGFLNDCVLAASALEHGFTIVTRDAAHFGLIAIARPGVAFVAPYP